MKTEDSSDEELPPLDSVKTRDDWQNRPTSPIVISTDDEGEMATPPTPPSPPKPKQVRFAEKSNVRTYLIDEDSKEMKKTGVSKKKKYEEFFPGMKEKLLAKVQNENEHDEGSVRYRNWNYYVIRTREWKN